MKKIIPKFFVLFVLCLASSLLLSCAGRGVGGKDSPYDERGDLPASSSSGGGESECVFSPPVENNACAAFPRPSSCEDFISTWRTTEPNETVELPLDMCNRYEFTVDWGDGSPISSVTSWGDPDKAHTYSSAGDYTIVIDGHMQGIASPSNQMISVSSLGDMGWIDFDYAFYGSNVTTVVGGNMAGVERMAWMFSSAPFAEPDTSSWDTSSVIDMSHMFSYAELANPDVSQWDTSSVTDMSSMFSIAYAANPDTSSWDTSSVTNMSSMFESATVANPDTSSWYTSSVTNMSSMFSSADAANPDVSQWDTSSVTDMSEMFLEATSANPEMEGWDFSQVTSMRRMFKDIDIGVTKYSNLLVQLAEENLNADVSLGGGDAKYNEAGAEARATLIERGWTIEDAGPE